MPTTTPAQMSLKNVLVPVDFSPLSEPAVKLAKALAQQHGSTIHLTNVIESLNVSGMFSNKFRKTDVERAMNDFRFIETRYFSGVKHETLVLDGDVTVSLPSPALPQASRTPTLGQGGKLWPDGW